MRYCATCAQSCVATACEAVEKLPGRLSPDFRLAAVLLTMSMCNCIYMFLLSMLPSQMLSMSLFISILVLFSMLTVHLV